MEGEPVQDERGPDEADLPLPLGIDFDGASLAWRANKLVQPGSRGWFYGRQIGDDVYARQKGARWQLGVVIRIIDDDQVEVALDTGRPVIVADEEASLRCWSTTSLMPCADGNGFRLRDKRETRKRKRRMLTGRDEVAFDSS